MLIEKWNKWLKYTVYIIIGCTSGVLSCLSEPYEYIYKPPLLFFAINAILFFDIFITNFSKFLMLLLSFFAIYIFVVVSIEFSAQFSMALGGCLTLLSYRILGIKIDKKSFAACILILVILGHSLFYLTFNYNSFFAYFFIILWHPVVFTTVALSVNNKENQREQEEDDQEPNEGAQEDYGENMN